MIFQKTSTKLNQSPFSRWGSFVAILLIGALYTTITPALTFGPRWLLIVLLLLLLVPSILTHRTGRHLLNQILGYIINGIVSIALVLSVVLLVYSLVNKKQSPIELLLSAAVLWVTNMFVFTLWYWRMDAGGPHQRYAKKIHTNGAFLFPQMALNEEKAKQLGQTRWVPGFIDYLFLAFNTSTAFSPTDTTAIVPWAKCLMMLQSLISFVCIVVLVSRAMNTL